MNLSATTFDPDNARACAQASAQAYSQSTLGDIGTDTHCTMVELPDCWIIAFRGSKSIRNWITDAEFERTLPAGVDTRLGVKVHAGFYQALCSVSEAIQKFLGNSPDFNDARPPGNCKPLFITGHSLGGALAVLTAIELHMLGFPIAQVYTFGQPRVGNAAFKKFYECNGLPGSGLGARTFRLVYQEDIVPRVPHLDPRPATWCDPYRHAGTEVFVSSFDCGLTFNPSWWRLLLSDVWGIYRAFLVSKFRGASEPLIDHHVNNYVAAVNVATARESVANQGQSLVTSSPTNTKVNVATPRESVANQSESNSRELTFTATTTRDSHNNQI
jgi:hypothetical protein